MDTVSNVSGLAHVAELLKSHDRFLVVPHVQPDADAYGSTVALSLMLQRLGKDVVRYSDEPVPFNCGFINALDPVMHEFPADHAERLMIFVDGGEKHRAPKTVRDRDCWMNLDHHEGNDQWAKHIYVDTQAAASALIVQRLVGPLGITMDAAMGTALFAGLLFDTRGGFITDRCSPEVFAAAGACVAAGAKPDHVNRELNERVAFQEAQLYGSALGKARLAAGGRLVMVAVTQAESEAAGGGDAAFELLTQHLPKIDGGEIFVLLRERKPGEVKLSFRSKGRLSVMDLAKRFNGGGHNFAAGGRFDGTLEEAQAAIAAAAESVLATLAT